MANQANSSPRSGYQADVLMLAPEAGEDRNVLSLVAQLLELGIAVELTDDWRLPTQPPRDLSAYRACLFPETARERYDADLNAFARGGGFLPYYKYYPVADGATMSGVHYFVDSFGRDVYMWHCANAFVEADVTLHHPDFAQALASRPIASIAADFRSHLFDRHAGREGESWTDWKDPDYIYLTNHALLSTHGDDPAWQNLVHSCLDRIAASVDDWLAGPAVQYQLEGVVENYVIMFTGLLIREGQRLDEQAWIDAGLKLGRTWFDANGCASGYRMAGHEVPWSEHCIILEGLYQYALASGDAAPRRMADAIVDEALTDVRRDDGLWAHVRHRDGRLSPLWCRGVSWVVHGMAWSLRALEGEAQQQRLAGLVNETFDALAPHQDDETGLWRLVVDDPMSRVETSATAVHVTAWDEMRRLGLAADRHAGMMDRAFTGLKRLCYRQGVAACCRGTTTGVDAYYRTRPLGYSPGSTHFGGALASRLDAAATIGAAV